MKFFLCLFVLVTIYNQASAIMCYVCNAPLGGSSACFRNKLTSNQLQNCSEGQNFCQTAIVATAMFGPDGITSMVRRCSSSNDNVSNGGSQIRFTVSCNTDRCNVQGPMFIDPPVTGAPGSIPTTTECNNGGNDGDGGGAAEIKSAVVVVFSLAMILTCKFL
ncbi:uncharacterized protein LOC120338399 [Styela clava]|uniref:ly6/PLAUR domain-containing protein 2-like n=1 Tax=Styela clava TaxID=7725 RepID=UPI00193A3743|nr:ly6/PLAUR domain-containing protein 2-like [Styela clava]